MDPFRGLGLPRIPGLPELVDVLQKQTEALAQLPRTMADLNTAVRELVAATRVATEAIASAQRTAERLEGLVEELEEPVRALRPGLERVGKVLDDPAIETVPDTLRTVADDLLDRKSTRLNSSHANISYAVFCLKKKKHTYI